MHCTILCFGVHQKDRTAVCLQHLFDAIGQDLKDRFQR